jgi:hypothetical protein
VKVKETVTEVGAEEEEDVDGRSAAGEPASGRRFARVLRFFLGFP